MFQANLQASLSGILPPNSAGICHATERALFISAHLSTEISPIILTLSGPFVKFAVSLRTLRLWEQHGAKARTSTSGESATGKKKISVSIRTALVLFMLA